MVNLIAFFSVFPNCAAWRVEQILILVNGYLFSTTWQGEKGVPGISGHFGTPGSYGEIGEFLHLFECSLYSLDQIFNIEFWRVLGGLQS